jgi:hypothetical protein
MICRRGLSPVTQAVGLGLAGAMSGEEFSRLHSFYREKDEPVRVEACPLADASLFEHLRAGRYRVTAFTSVMAQRPPHRPKPAGERGGIAVALVGPGEVD